MVKNSRKSVNINAERASRRLLNTRDRKITDSLFFREVKSFPISVSLVLLFYILFPESFNDISNDDDVNSSYSHNGRGQHGGWRNKVKGVFHHLLCSKVDEEREKEDHEAVEEETEEGGVPGFFMGARLKIPRSGLFG